MISGNDKRAAKVTNNEVHVRIGVGGALMIFAPFAVPLMSIIYLLDRIATHG